jgi:hypothetical protein
LWLGTPAQNNADMTRKGRGVPPKVGSNEKSRARGERHGCAKLTMEMAAAIRASTERVAVLAAQYNMSTSNIYRIKHSQLWRESPRPSPGLPESEIG